MNAFSNNAVPQRTAANTTDAQQALLDDVARLATLSDQHEDRKRLRDAYPQLMSAISPSGNGHCTGYAGHLEDEERQAVIEKFWPMDRTIAEIEGGRLEQGHPQVKAFDFNGEGFERDVVLDVSQIRVKVHTSQDEALDGEPYEEDGEFFTTEEHSYTENHFLVLSKRVALRITTNCGEYTDDDNDVSMNAVVFLSEDAEGMLNVIRRELKSMGEQHKMHEIEPQFEAVFGSDYAPPAPAKGPRP